MFRPNFQAVLLLACLFLINLVYCADEVVIATNNPGQDSVYNSGDEIVLDWSYKSPPANTSKEALESQYFKLNDVDYITIQFMTGSDLQNRVVSNLTIIKPTDKKELSFIAPKFPFKGRLFYFRYIIYFKDISKGAYNDTVKGYKYNWSTRFDIYPTLKGSEVNTATLVDDVTKPTAIKPYNPPPQPSTIINPGQSDSKISATLSTFTLVGLALLSSFL